MSRATQDAISFADISSSTAAFQLGGGKYGVSCVATFGGGSADLQVLAEDKSTYVSCGSETKFTANAFGVADLPAGSYKVVIATATAVYVGIRRIPGE